MSYQARARRVAVTMATQTGRGLLAGGIAVAAIVAGALLQVAVAWVVG